MHQGLEWGGRLKRRRNLRVSGSTTHIAQWMEGYALSPYEVLYIFAGGAREAKGRGRQKWLGWGGEVIGTGSRDKEKKGRANEPVSGRSMWGCKGEKANKLEEIVKK